MREAVRSLLVLALLWAHGPLPAAAAAARVSAFKPVSLTPTQSVLPQSPGLSSLASPSLLLAPSLQLAPLLQLPQPITPTVTPEAAPAPAPAKEAMTAARDFLAEVPVSEVPVDQAGAAGGKLMDKVLGSRSAPPTGSLGALTVSPESFSGKGAPPLAKSEPSAKTPKRYVHLLAKPVKVAVKLGPVAVVFHYAFEAVFQIVKAILAFAAGGFWAAVPIFLIELVKMPAMIGAQSMLDLQTRYRWKLSKALRPLAQVPGVERIRVLTTSQTRFKGVVAQMKKNLGFVFLESSQPTLDLPAFLGTALPIEDPATMRLRLTFSRDGQSSAVEWRPTLQELMDNTPIPPDITSAWRALLGPMSALKVKGLKIEAALLEPSGRQKSLGTLTEGQSILHLLRMTRTDRVLAAVKRLGPGPGPVKAAAGRSIALSSSEVVDASQAGPWSLPRRLLGRLLLRR